MKWSQAETAETITQDIPIIKPTPVFLRAEWRKLAMLNYTVDPALLKPFLPDGTELDTWQGTHFISLVGFMFKNTRLKGFPIPFHKNFEEVNLRFYVRHKSHDGWRRGVVFIKEIVPRPALSLVAHTIYGEHYETVPMRHSWTTDGQNLKVTYAWKKKDWHTPSVVAQNIALPIPEGSLDEFITDHYWGYTRLSDHQTSHYGVEHPKWLTYPVRQHHVNVDFEAIYGERFKFLTHAMPASTLLAEGSEILVRSGTRF